MNVQLPVLPPLIAAHMFLVLPHLMQVPASKGYVVGDIIITSKGNIRYGAMLADYIKIKLTGLACNKNKSNVKPVSADIKTAAAQGTDVCRGPAAVHQNLAAHSA
jgi:hypothetical protein